MNERTLLNNVMQLVFLELNKFICNGLLVLHVHCSASIRCGVWPIVNLHT